MVKVNGVEYASERDVPEQFRMNTQSGSRQRDVSSFDSSLAPNLGRTVIPHVTTFSGMLSTLARTYRNHDEAIRHNIQNANMMRRDIQIMGPLLVRQQAVSLLQWSVEPEDSKDASQVRVAKELENLISRIPRFREYLRNLMEAVWYGRYAIQNVWGFHRGISNKRYRNITNWVPVNGDKLQFRYDDGTGRFDPNEVGIKVSPAHIKNDVWQGKPDLEWNAEGSAVFLRRWERTRLTLHKHFLMDGDYEDPTSSGMIHGVGLRHFLYWSWYQKQETLAQLAEVVERTGMGFTVYYYPAGNDAARQEMETIAQDQAHKNQIVMPMEAANPNAYGIEQIPPNTQGIAALQTLIDDYFGNWIIRFILGQTLSYRADAGTPGISDLHRDSFLQVIKFDAVGLEETITRELLSSLVAFNFPSYKSVNFNFRLNTQEAVPTEKLQALQAAWSMGAKIKANDVMGLIGLNVADNEDDALYNPQVLSAIKQYEQMEAEQDKEDTPTTTPDIERELAKEYGPILNAKKGPRPVRKPRKTGPFSGKSGDSQDDVQKAMEDTKKKLKAKPKKYAGDGSDLGEHGEDDLDITNKQINGDATSQRGELPEEAVDSTKPAMPKEPDVATMPRSDKPGRTEESATVGGSAGLESPGGVEPVSWDDTSIGKYLGSINMAGAKSLILKKVTPGSPGFEPDINKLPENIRPLHPDYKGGIKPSDFLDSESERPVSGGYEENLDDMSTYKTMSDVDRDDVPAETEKEIEKWLAEGDDPNKNIDYGNIMERFASLEEEYGGQPAKIRKRLDEISSMLSSGDYEEGQAVKLFQEGKLLKDIQAGLSKPMTSKFSDMADKLPEDEVRKIRADGEVKANQIIDSILENAENKKQALYDEIRNRSSGMDAYEFNKLRDGVFKQSNRRSFSVEKDVSNSKSYAVPKMKELLKDVIVHGELSKAIEEGVKNESQENDAENRPVAGENAGQDREDQIVKDTLASQEERLDSIADPTEEDLKREEAGDEVSDGADLGQDSADSGVVDQLPTESSGRDVGVVPPESTGEQQVSAETSQAVDVVPVREQGGDEEPEPEGDAQETAKGIRKEDLSEAVGAYFMFADGRSNKRVRLSDMRKAMPDLSREQFDGLMKQMEKDGIIVLGRLDDPRQITKKDEKAAIKTGLGDPRHLVFMDLEKAYSAIDSGKKQVGETQDAQEEDVSEQPVNSSEEQPTESEIDQQEDTTQSDSAAQNEVQVQQDETSQADEQPEVQGDDELGFAPEPEEEEVEKVNLEEDGDALDIPDSTNYQYLFAREVTPGAFAELSDALDIPEDDVKNLPKDQYLSALEGLRKMEIRYAEEAMNNKVEAGRISEEEAKEIVEKEVGDWNKRLAEVRAAREDRQKFEELLKQSAQREDDIRDLELAAGDIDDGTEVGQFVYKNVQDGENWVQFWYDKKTGKSYDRDQIKKALGPQYKTLLERAFKKDVSNWSDKLGLASIFDSTLSGITPEQWGQGIKTRAENTILSAAISSNMIDPMQYPSRQDRVNAAGEAIKPKIPRYQDLVNHAVSKGYQAKGGELFDDIRGAMGFMVQKAKDKGYDPNASSKNNVEALVDAIRYDNENKTLIELIGGKENLIMLAILFGGLMLAASFMRK